MKIRAFGSRGPAFTLLTVTAAAGLAGCLGGSGGSSSNVEPPGTFSAQIQRTAYGIPHITADDYKGIGYGVGYAFAQENICSLAREIIVDRGESMLYLQEGGDLANDIFYTWYNSQDQLGTFLDTQTQEVKDAVQGYAAGYSRYLRDTGVDNIDPACAGEPWVREIEVADLIAVYSKGNLRGGLSNFVQPIVAAAPPSQSVAPAARMMSNEQPAFDMTTIDVLDGGSNAYAFGSETTANGSGMLYGNPHEPWNGVQRFYEFHITIPGEIDAMGVGQQGQPFPNIGFNKDVAWSHTVSTAKRFTLNQLLLVEGDPMKYRYFDAQGNEEQRDIVREPVTVQLPEGGTHEAAIYTSHLGPMLAVNLLNAQLPPWGGSNLAFSIRDAASENARAIEQWLAMNKATSVDSLLATMREVIGLPFVNTIAADRFGNALYADISTVPHVTAAKLTACSSGPALGALVAANLPALNGSSAQCEWGNDADSPQAGIFGAQNLPALVRSDYVTNSNDPYWLSNPEAPLTGFSPLLRRRLTPFPDTTVAEANPLLLRTRMGLQQVFDRLDGSDGLGGNDFDLETLQEVVYSNRSYAAELVLDDVLADCVANPLMPVTGGGTVNAAPACAILTAWDRRNNLESRGAHVFREFWRNVDFTETTDTLFATPFDETDPVDTPRDLIITEETRTALGDAITLFQDNDIALDAPLGTIQFVVDAGNGNERIPMHGGQGREGVFNVAQGPGPEGTGLYTPIVQGPTYMQTVTFDAEGPVVEALLAYSQSADTTNPNHRDQTREYSGKRWIRLPFTAQAVAEQALGEPLELNE